LYLGRPPEDKNPNGKSQKSIRNLNPFFIWQ
jgi:hypothetical protein